MGRIVRAILIDPFACSVTLVDHDRLDLRNVYLALSHQIAHVNIFDVAYPDSPFADTDAIFYDAEGGVRPGNRFFKVAGHNPPIAGKGLVLGTASDGDMTDCATELATVRRATRFYECIDELGLVDTLTPWPVLAA